MRANPRHDPRHFDVADAAAHALELRGDWPLAELLRLVADHPTDAPPPAGAVAWSARAFLRQAAGAPAEIWLQLQARALLPRSCQRCLQPVTLALAVDRALRFVPGEEAAAALDADSDEDVLALEPELDLRQLVEDELLLALPLVPRHEACPDPLPQRAGEIEEAHPFAALAGLKPGRPPH